MLSKILWIKSFLHMKIYEDYELLEKYKNKRNECIYLYTYDYIITDYTRHINNTYLNEAYTQSVDITHKVEKRQNFIKNLNFLLVMSSKNNTIDKIKLPKLVEKIDTFICEYPNIKHELKDKIIIPFLQNMVCEKKIKISPIFIVGSPGTGKTRFMEKLSEIFDIQNIIFENINKNRTDTRIMSYLDEIKIDSTDYLTQMKYNSLIKCGNDYSILFIDEFDKKIIGKDNDSINLHFLNEMLIILNSGYISSNDTYIPCMNVKIENLIIVCASNTHIDTLCKTDSRLDPLKSRFVEITFPDINKSVQIEILEKYLKLYFSERSIQFSKKDSSFISSLVEKTEYRGVRELLNILNIYVNKIYSVDILCETIWKIEDIQKIRDDILNEITCKQKKVLTDSEKKVLTDSESDSITLSDSE